MEEKEKAKKPVPEESTKLDFPEFRLDIMTKSDKSLSADLKLETKNKLKKAD